MMLSSYRAALAVVACKTPGGGKHRLSSSYLEFRLLRKSTENVPLASYASGPLKPRKNLGLILTVGEVDLIMGGFLKLGVPFWGSP